MRPTSSLFAHSPRGYAERRVGFSGVVKADREPQADARRRAGTVGTEIARRRASVHAPCGSVKKCIQALLASLFGALIVASMAVCRFDPPHQSLRIDRPP